MSAAVQLDMLAAAAPAPRVHRTAVRAHLRTVKGSLPVAAPAHTPSEAVTIALDYVRAKLAELYRSRAASWSKERTPFVNADDAARILREWAECPSEIHHLGHQNWRGHIFRAGWVKTGTYSPSLRKHMRATDLPGWRLA
jgi:hypothetical protein